MRSLSEDTDVRAKLAQLIRMGWALCGLGCSAGVWATTMHWRIASIEAWKAEKAAPLEGYASFREEMADRLGRIEERQRADSEALKAIMARLDKR